MLKLFFSLLLVASLSACFSKRPNESYLPPAKGHICEILLVIDSSLWHGQLGDTLRYIFSSAYLGLPQYEPSFDLDVVNPLEMSVLQKQSRNIVFVTVIDNVGQGNRAILANFTNESLEIIEEDSSVFSFYKMNAYAEGQQVLHLFGKNTDELIHNLSINKVHIRAMLLESEKRRLANLLFTNEQKELTNDIRLQFGFSLRIPQDYKIIKQDSSFFWLKTQEQQVGKNLFISQKDYQSVDDFKPENILAWRQQIANRYLMDDSGKPENVSTIQKIIPPIYKAINLGGLYVLEIRALWQTPDLSKGGTLISYVWVNEATQKMIYLEAFISAPGQDKRDLMLEMETLLRGVKK